MKIIALMENTAAVPDVLSEHGLSLYLEGKGHRILFDTGQSENFAVNAKRLGVDLAAVDLAILSHGHYDHGGGLKRFLELNQKAPVYLSVYAFEPHFNGVKDIGIDPKLRESGRLRFVKEKTVLDEGLELYPNDRIFPEGSGRFRRPVYPPGGETPGGGFPPRAVSADPGGGEEDPYQRMFSCGHPQYRRLV